MPTAEQKRWSARQAVRWRALLVEESAGQPARVELRPEVREGIAGGVRFVLPMGVTDDAMRAIVGVMIATARVLEGATRVGDGGIGATVVKLWGRGGERRFRQMLDDLEVEPPLRNSTIDPVWLRRGPSRLHDCHAALDAEGLTIEYPYESIGSHEDLWQSSPYARVPVAALPMDAEVFREMMRTIDRAASSYVGSGAVRVCSHCARTLAMSEMRDDTTCQRCAPPA